MLKLSYEELYDLYINKGMSALTIGNMFGYKSENPVCNLLKKYKITKDNKERIKQAKLQRAKTNLERYGVEFPQSLETTKEKVKQTNLERYGVENPSYLKEVKAKIRMKNTLNCKIRMEKVKQTNLERYGVTSYTKTEEYKNRVKQTNLEKYGVTSVLLRKDIIKLTHSDEIITKQINTKRLNKTFNNSKIETILYEKLCNKFGEVKRQYKSELYPFACDFYIPSLDLYIEYQGFWTHGKEPYTESNPLHQEKIKLWKSKNTPQYKKAIKDWTERDILKRNTAKDNNLNWIEFFDMEQFNQWFDKL